MATKSISILADDTSPYLSFGPNWWLDVGTQYSIGNFGSIYNSTQHGTDTNGAQMTFTFAGTGFEIYGRSDYVKTDNGSYSPALHCTLDGATVIDTDFTLISPQSDNQILCRAYSLVDNSHTVVATVSTAGQPLWIDFILIEPTNTTHNLQDYTRIVQNYDNSITYNDGWALGIAQKKGATLKVEFIGMAITWYSTLGSENLTSTASSSGSYSIDGQAETSFAIPWSATNLFFQPLFSVSNLSTQPHSLAVTYQGDSGTQVSLNLDHLIIAGDGTPTSAPAASSSTPLGVPSTTNHGNTKSRPPIGAIIGGTLGGAAIIIGIILLWLLHRKRSRMSLVPDDSFVVPEPFITSPVEPEPIPIRRASSPSMRRTELNPTIHTTSFTKSPLPALQPSLIRPSTHDERSRLVATGSSTSQTNQGLSPSARANTASRLRLVHHEDSGSRFDGVEETVMDVPPGYTES